MTKQKKEFNPLEHIREQFEEGKISLAESMTLQILVKISGQLQDIKDLLYIWDIKK